MASGIRVRFGLGGRRQRTAILGCLLPQRSAAAAGAAAFSELLHPTDSALALLAAPYYAQALDRQDATVSLVINDLLSPTPG